MERPEARGESENKPLRKVEAKAATPCQKIWVLTKVATCLYTKKTMRQVSIKDFQNNIYLHIKELPIEITRYGTPIFWVVSESPEKKEVEEIPLPPRKPYFCEISEANPNVNCRRAPSALYKILYTGGEEPATWELWLCEAHSKFQGGDVEVTKL